MKEMIAVLQQPPCWLKFPMRFGPQQEVTTLKTHVPALLPLQQCTHALMSYFQLLKGICYCSTDHTHVCVYT